MTPEELDEVRRYFDSYEFQDENGIDLTLVDEMLAMTPAERIRSLEKFLEFDRVLTSARVRSDGAVSRNAQASERDGR